MTIKTDTTSDLLVHFKPEQVRKVSNEFLNRAKSGSLRHLSVDAGKLKTALVAVLETTRQTYPDYQIPPHGVWRSFEAGQFDRWSALASIREFQSADGLLAAAADLAILAAYLDVQTPAGWSYHDVMAGTVAEGREASALAAINMFAAGSFSSDPSDPFRVDADALIRLDPEELVSGLQWDATAHAAQLTAMQRHLKRFGEALALRPDLYGVGDTTRPGNMLVKLGNEGWGSVDATIILDQLLQSLAPLWEGGAAQGVVSFGDSFAYPCQDGEGPSEIVPFHMTAQTMVYSLVEPLAWAGYEVEELEALTAPADREHAALLFETGVLSFARDGEALSPGEAQDRMIEARALTGALIDQLADMLRKELGAEADHLPLSCILEGGSRRAGLEILHKDPAKALKLGEILNPGSVFWLPFEA